MGITSHLDAYYAEAIGGLDHGVSPLEMANAYATVADGGWRNTVTAITKVVHPDGTVDDLGKAERTQDVHRRRGIRGDRDPAMKEVLSAARGRQAQHRLPGRRQDRHDDNYTDAWFVGYHAETVDRRVGRLPERRPTTLGSSRLRRHDRRRRSGTSS